MPTHPEPDFDVVSQQALRELKSHPNPFVLTTVVAGVEDECLAADVPEIFQAQRADLRDVVELYRQPNQPSRVVPIIGERGVGKSHMLLTFRAEMTDRPFRRGLGTLLFVADNYSDRLDSVDYFLWQVVNHLLSSSVEKAQALNRLAQMTASRLLSEALCRATHLEKIRMIPTNGPLGRLSLWTGLGGAARNRIERADRLARACEDESTENLATACEEVDISVQVAQRLIVEYLNQSESRDAMGLMRRELYSKLSRLALTGERDPLEEYLTGGYLEGVDSTSRSGRSSRLLLKALLELFHTFEIATVLVFDQLEDFLRAPSPDAEDQLRRAFSQSLAALVNHVPGLCILVFTERGLWDAVSSKMDAYARDRLLQPFSLPGRSLQDRIALPSSLDREVITHIIQRRVRPLLPGLDLTGLDEIFPFRESDLEKSHEWQTIRVTLKELAQIYNSILHAETEPSSALIATPIVGPEPGKTSIDGGYLRARWQTALASARKSIAEGITPALIPEVQTSLDTWLRFLKKMAIPETEGWAKIELITDTDKGPYGYLNVLRFDRVNDPGIGIAVWLGQGTVRPHDLRCRLAFFKANPCPIKTLILFREDGEASLSGVTRTTYKEAINAGRDVRIIPYLPSDFEALIAFTRWHHMIHPDVQLAGPESEAALKEYAPKLSDKLLAWIAEWRLPLAEEVIHE